MPEDKLTRAERIRLESLSQALQITIVESAARPTLKTILDNAERIEAWLRKAREDG
jgi:hypothetical protein